jgi:adenosylhomocysteine nucleosidase
LTGTDRGVVVVVLAPMRSELRPVVRALSGRPDKVGDVDVHRGRVGGRDVVAGLIGVGPEAARRSTQRLLGALAGDGVAVSHVLVSGIAGGIGPGIEVGDTVVPDVVVDLASGQEFASAPCPGASASGTIATTHELILDARRLAGLADRGIVALDMETAAVAEVCAAQGRPWSAFRVISDRPQDGLLDESVMGMLNPDGSTNPWAAARHILTHPWRLRALARLGRDATAAASKAAVAAVAGAAEL